MTIMHINSDSRYKQKRLLRREIEVNEQLPKSLVDASRTLVNYPTSIRQANRLYEVALPLIKAKDLFYRVPLSYRITMTYLPEGIKPDKIFAYGGLMMYLESIKGEVLEFARSWNSSTELLCLSIVKNLNSSLVIVYRIKRLPVHVTVGYVSEGKPVVERYSLSTGSISLPFGGTKLS